MAEHKHEDLVTQVNYPWAKGASWLAVASCGEGISARQSISEQYYRRNYIAASDCIAEGAFKISLPIVTDGGEDTMKTHRRGCFDQTYNMLRDLHQPSRSCSIHTTKCTCYINQWETFKNQGLSSILRYKVYKNHFNSVIDLMPQFFF